MKSFQTHCTMIYNTLKLDFTLHFVDVEEIYRKAPFLC